MAELVSIPQIRSRHDRLYSDVIKRAAGGGLDLDEANRQVDELLATMASVDTARITLDDYDWLTNALVQWQAVSSAILKKPRDVDIPDPPSPNVIEQSSIGISRAAFKQQMELAAQDFAKRRRSRWQVEEAERLMARIQEQLQEIAHQPSSDEERAADWHAAQVLAAARLIDGKLQISRGPGVWALVQLREVWLDEVKQLMAYERWEQRGRPAVLQADEDYLAACALIRARMLDPEKRPAIDEFEEARLYLEKEFLTDGKLDESRAPVIEMLRRKADRLRAVTGRTDEDANERAARAYAKAFYESIVAAVTKQDGASVAAVVGALELGDGPTDNHPMIDCFEAALVVSFLDGKAALL